MPPTPGSDGAFTFWLHTHLPYVRRNGAWPHGQEWMYEAMAETYVPLLEILRGLAVDGIRGGITIDLTPILCEQLADRGLASGFLRYVSDRARRARLDIRRFGPDGLPKDVLAKLPGIGDAPRATRPDEGLRRLAQWYAEWFEATAERLSGTYRGDLLAAFRGLQDDGVIEIATSAATHGYLPLLARDSSIRGQIREGIRSYERHFGRRPRAIWLPECAYRPAVPEGNPGEPARPGASLRSGLETFLEVEGLTVFVAETQLVVGGPATSATRGELIGPYGAVARRRGAPTPGDEPIRPATSYEPYWVRDSEVAVIARNERTGLQVWSGTVGYPGDAVYRDFHKRDAASGLQYWRVTGPGVDLADKQPWDPAAASSTAQHHAHHFADLVRELLASQIGASDAGSGRPSRPVIVSAYDTELFGHWWFEGVSWLGSVIRALAAEPRIELTTAGAWVETNPPTHAIELPEGSWGLGATHYTWWNDQTEWFWPLIHAAERRLEGLVAGESETARAGDRKVRRDRTRERLFRQAARELLLLQASDWPFLVTTGQAAEYAAERFRAHLARFGACCDALAEENLTRSSSRRALELVRGLEEQDNAFPTIDPESFAPARSSGSSSGRVPAGRQG